MPVDAGRERCADMDLELMPTDEQRSALVATLRTVNAAANDLLVAFADRATPEARLRDALRRRGGVPAPLVVEVLRRYRSAPRGRGRAFRYRPQQAIVLPGSRLTWLAQRVRIPTVRGTRTIAYRQPPGGFGRLGTGLEGRDVLLMMAADRFLLRDGTSGPGRASEGRECREPGGAHGGRS